MWNSPNMTLLSWRVSRRLRNARLETHKIYLELIIRIYATDSGGTGVTERANRRGVQVPEEGQFDMLDLGIEASKSFAKSVCYMSVTVICVKCRPIIRSSGGMCHSKDLCENLLVHLADARLPIKRQFLGSCWCGFVTGPFQLEVKFLWGCYNSEGMVWRITAEYPGECCRRCIICRSLLMA